MVSGKAPHILRAGVFAALLLTLISCQRHHLTLADPGTDVDGDEYEDVVAAWTRETQLYGGFDLHILAKATYLSWDVRRHALAFLRQRKRLSLNQAQALWRKMEHQAVLHHEFLLSVYVPRRRWNNLSAQEPLWTVSLEGGNGTLAQAESVRLRKADPELLTLFPHIEPHYLHYWVQFPIQAKGPISAQSASFKLRIASALGTALLEWNVASEKGSPST